jgi:hypothetical protein
MANEVGLAYKDAILSGLEISDIPINIYSPAGGWGIFNLLWSNSANRSFLSSRDDILEVYVTGMLEATAMSGFSKSSTGVWDASDVTHVGVSGANCSYMTCVVRAASTGKGYSIVVIDTATGLPFTPTGGDVSIVWDNGTNRIFKL